MGDKSTAFVKGGCGCLLGFLGLGFLVLVLGGRVRMDLGGALLLFLIGGVSGLVFLAGYKKSLHSRQEQATFPAPPPPATWWCRACGSSNPLEAKICQRCHATR
jgi:hypothetical protein